MKIAAHQFTLFEPRPDILPTSLAQLAHIVATVL